MTIRHMFDTAYPPSTPYPGTQAVAGYVGGNTPHVWSLSEWLRFSHLRSCPIWTGYGETRPEAQGVEAGRAARALGWKPFARVRRLLVDDRETSPDLAWDRAFAKGVAAQGFLAVKYGNVRAEWVASWDAGTTIPPGALALQYKGNVPYAGTQVDLSVIGQEFWLRLGRGPRHYATV